MCMKWRVRDGLRRGLSLQQKFALTLVALAYLISPLDFIPDFLIGVGWLDDATVLYWMLRIWMSPTLSRSCSRQVAVRRRRD